MKPYEKREFDKLVTILQENVEEFRFEAARAYAAYTRANRRLLRRARPEVMIYQRFNELFKPTDKLLKRKQSYDATVTQLTKNLLISSIEADHIAHSLYENRQVSLITETIAPLPQRAQKGAATLLAMPANEIEQLLASYKQATLYQDAAAAFSIATYDRHRRLVPRAIARLRIQRQRKKQFRAEQKRITAIDRELQKVDERLGDLLRRMVSYELEIIEIAALRNTFSKKAVSARGNSARKQLSEFEKTTTPYLDAQLKSYQAAYDTISLKQLASVKRGIERVLHDTFALSNGDLNRHVMAYSTYAKLFNEKQSILTAHNERQQFIDRQ